MTKRGWIYYICCTETFRCKIGYTGGNVYARLKALQTGSPTSLVVMAVHPGTQEDERALHNRFASQRVRGEWFEPSEEMLEHVSMVTWLTASSAIQTGAELPDWARIGLATMHTEMGPLPPDMAELVADTIAEMEAERSTIQ